MVIWHFLCENFNKHNIIHFEFPRIVFLFTFLKINFIFFSELIFLLFFFISFHFNSWSLFTQVKYNVRIIRNDQSKVFISTSSLFRITSIEDALLSIVSTRRFCAKRLYATLAIGQLYTLRVIFTFLWGWITEGVSLFIFGFDRRSRIFRFTLSVLNTDCVYLHRPSWNMQFVNGPRAIKSLLRLC